MRLIYAGTPDFAVPALEALIAAGHQIALVLTQPDRPAGRGMQPALSAVKLTAQRRGLPVYQPATLKSIEDQAPLLQAKADAYVVAAYGLLLPQALLETPPLGAFNIHASLLPRWRGAAPVQRAILAGDSETGICIMRMEVGLDTGPVIARETIAIDPKDTAGTLQLKLAALGAHLIDPALRAFADGTALPEPQRTQGITYARKITKSESAVDWRQSAEQIERLIRAFNPTPGARARIADTDLKLWGAAVARGSEKGVPGRIREVTDAGITVDCGEDVLCLQELQRPGAKRLSTKDFLRGFELKPGQRFDLIGD